MEKGRYLKGEAVLATLKNWKQYKKRHIKSLITNKLEKRMPKGMSYNTNVGCNRRATVLTSTDPTKTDRHFRCKSTKTDLDLTNTQADTKGFKNFSDRTF